MAITPFPISAHRTGGPDFRSPALRLASPQGTRRGCEWQAFEAQQTEFPIDSVVREPAGAASCHGALLPGTSRLPTVVLSRCTLFLDGLVPRYHWPFALYQCGPNE